MKISKADHRKTAVGMLQEDGMRGIIYKDPSQGKKSLQTGFASPLSILLMSPWYIPVISGSCFCVMPAISLDLARILCIQVKPVIP